MRRVTWSMWLGSVTDGGAGLAAGGLALATAMRVVGGSGVAVLTGRYACVTTAFACGKGFGLGNGLGAAALGGRFALRASDFAFLAACGFSAVAGLAAMRCCVARCCWYAANALYVVA